MDVLLHQLHVTSEAGLRLAQDNLEFFLFGSFDHAVEVRAVTVHAGKILVAIDGVDIPAVVDGVMGEQGFLVLDALGFGLMLVFVLLTQSCIDCTKDLLNLLKGITAHCHDTAEAAEPQGFI